MDECVGGFISTRTYLEAVEQVLERAVAIGVTRLAGIGVLGPQELEDKANVVDDWGGMSVHPHPFLDLGGAGREELGRGDELLHALGIVGRGRGQDFLQAPLVGFDFDEANAASAAGGEGGMGAEGGNKGPRGTGGLEDGGIGRDFTGLAIDRDVHKLFVFYCPWLASSRWYGRRAEGAGA